MPPPGYEPFLRAICADPEDDTVRLVYADWLDENGDPDRAEFIRVSIEYGRACAMPTFSSALLTRYTAAYRNLERWKSELPKLPGINWPGAFRRGFPHEVAVSDGRKLVVYRATIFEAAPIDSVSIADVGSSTLMRVGKLSELERVRHLWLHHCRLVSGEWGTVAKCPHLVRLNLLGLSRPVQATPAPILTDADAATLAESPFLSRDLILRLGGWVSAETLALLSARFAEVRSHPLPLA